MTIKKNYEIGDPVWIHGVGRSNKLTKGIVVKKFNIEYDNYNKENIENIFKDIKIYNILDCKYLLFLHLFIRKKLIDF